MLSLQSHYHRASHWLLVILVISLGHANSARAEDPKSGTAPTELGSIAWARNFDHAAAQAASQDEALLVLFQEVPGCSTCVQYGQQVLSHPLIVEAAETLFVPVAIYNNIKGHDEKVLKSFKEPSWNNPVVRIVKADRKSVIPRLNDDYTVAGLAGTMVKALHELQCPVPQYLELLAAEQASRRKGLNKATFSMHCFWEGEVALGSLPGVVQTMPGFIGEKEVVDVEFDPSVISYTKLIKQAVALKCADAIFTRSDAQQSLAHDMVGERAVRNDEQSRPDKEPKYHLLRTPLKHVPMTSLQTCRVNAALGRQEDATVFLSPRQLALLAKIDKHTQISWPVVVGAGSMLQSWREVQRLASSL